jgi:hypothetical protein
MARTSTRRWKGCHMCKYHKDASLPDRERMPYSALREFPDPRGVTRHDVGLFEGTDHTYDPATPLDADDGTPAVRYKSRKNTRRWCKGKPGREHVLIVRKNPRWGFTECGIRSSYTWLTQKWYCTHEEVCQSCGKRLRWSLPVAECPDWIRQKKEVA